MDAAVMDLPAIDGLVAALSWEPQIKGALYVVLSVVILCGSAYLLLATNMGARLGFQIAAAGLFGFLVTIGIVWWVYGIGPMGSSPSWHVEETLVGSPSTAEDDALVGFPQGWRELDVADPAVADAQPVVDGALTEGVDGDDGLFQSADDYVAIQAYQKGGETYGPLGLDFRPFDIFHKPNYLVVQVQEVREVEVPEGATPPPPEPDPDAPVTSVLMLRDLGSLRLNPAVFTIASGIIFGILVYQLHVHDKEAWARKEEQEREAEGGKTPVRA